MLQRKILIFFKISVKSSVKGEAWTSFPSPMLEFCKSYAGDHRCCVFMSVLTIPCPEGSFPQLSSPSSRTYTQTSMMLLQPCGRTDTDVLFKAKHSLTNWLMLPAKWSCFDQGWDSLRSPLLWEYSHCLDTQLRVKGLITMHIWAALIGFKN